MANTALVTTGLVPLTIGSVEKFQHQGFINSLPWDLRGGTVSLNMLDPNGGSYSYPATIQADGTVFVQWTVIAPVGNWTRAWVVTDANTVHQVSRAIIFSVVQSP
jgi:hypothetical protein